MGCNSRLDSLQAVVGNWLINQVDFITDTRIKNAAYLDRGLARIPGIKLPQRFNNRKLVFHLYIVFAERRDELVAHCKKQGIEVKVHYPVPLYQQEGLRAVRLQEGRFPRDGPARRDDDLLSGARASDRGAARVYRPDGRRVLWGLKWRSTTFPT